MRQVAKLRINPAQFDAHRASIQSWLFALAAWLIDHLAPAARNNAWLAAKLRAARGRVDFDLRVAAYTLRLLLIVHARARLPAFATPAFTRTHHPANTPRGFRTTRRLASRRRRLTSCVVQRAHSGSLHELAQRLAAAYADFEALVAKVAARMLRVFTRPRAEGLVLAFAHADAIVSTPAHIAHRADTS